MAHELERGEPDKTNSFCLALEKVLEKVPGVEVGRGRTVDPSSRTQQYEREDSKHLGEDDMVFSPAQQVSISTKG